MSLRPNRSSSGLRYSKACCRHWYVVVGFEDDDVDAPAGTHELELIGFGEVYEVIIRLSSPNSPAPSATHECEGTTPTRSRSHSCSYRSAPYRRPTGTIVIAHVVNHRASSPALPATAAASLRRQAAACGGSGYCGGMEPESVPGVRERKGPGRAAGPLRDQLSDSDVRLTVVATTSNRLFLNLVLDVHLRCLVRAP